MIAVMMMLSTALAQDAASGTADLGDEVFLQSIDYLAATVLQPAGRAAWPGGVTVEWESGGGELTLGITNNGSTVLEIDWSRSAVVDNNGLSDRLVPGSARRGQVGQVLPPTIIPPGGTMAEALVRAGAVSMDGVEPLLTGARPGQTATVTLSVSGRFITQRFTVAHRPEILSTLADRRRAEVEAHAADAEAARRQGAIALAEQQRQAALAQARAEVLREAEGFNAEEARYRGLYDDAVALAEDREGRLGRWGGVAAAGGALLVIGLAGDSGPGVLAIAGGAGGGGLAGAIVCGAQASRARAEAKQYLPLADAERAKGDAVRARAAAIQEVPEAATPGDGE